MAPFDSVTQRNPDASAGVYVALVSLLMVACLAGAFVLPTSIALDRWIGIAALAGLFLGVPVLDRVAHRSRIREAVGELGGTTVSIHRLPFWKQFDDSMAVRKRLPIARQIKYEVEYADAAGSLHRAFCRSGWFHGVQWLEDVIVQ
jgi:hypothetical protein